MAKGLTEKQRGILEYVIDFQKQNGFPPTIREIGEAFEIGSLRGVTVHLDALVRKGFITRGRTSRSIRVLMSSSGEQSGTSAGAGDRLPLVTRLPHEVVSVAAAISPSGRFVSVGSDLAAEATAAGFVIVSGAPMTPDEPIVPGDLLVIRPQDTALGDELVAIRHDDSLRVRRGADPLGAVVGRVVGLIRRY